MTKTPSQYIDWLARIQEGADVSLIAVNQEGKLHWTLHAEGLPAHAGVMHVEADSAEECVRRAHLQLTAAVVRRIGEASERRAQRCPYWNKKRFQTEQEAQDALVVLARTHQPGERIPTAAYYCDPGDPKKRGCGWYHLTSHPRAGVGA